MKDRGNSVPILFIVYPFAASLNAKKAIALTRGVRLPKIEGPDRGQGAYISTMNLLVSSFQVTKMYQAIMARATRARVPP